MFVRQRSGGFTLLELTVVLAILVAVAGAAIISLSSSEDDTKVMLAKSEMATLRDACVRWKQDMGTFLPDPTVDFPTVANGPVTGTTALQSFRTATASGTWISAYPGALTPLVALEIGVISGTGAGAGANLTAPTLTAGALPAALPPIAAPGSGSSVPQELGLFSILPFNSTGGPNSSFANWNPTTRRGWRGPYLSFPDTLLANGKATPLRVIVLQEDSTNPTEGTYELADAWDAGGTNTAESAHSWYSYALTRDPRDNATGVPTLPPVGFSIKCYGPLPTGRPTSASSTDQPSIVVSYP